MARRALAQALKKGVRLNQGHPLEPQNLTLPTPDHFHSHLFHKIIN